ncbi:MAG: hypothetical protein OXR66_08995 [Candidatus Woesearchaeota archaeon]|nr:hypothetical protein [Candidatus Woesearchaeota archaeon]
MWITVIMGVVNFALSALGTWLLRLPGFDLSPVGILMVAQGGENTIVGACILATGYMLPRPARFGFIWLEVPVLIGMGYLAGFVNGYVLIAGFYTISVVAGVLMGIFGGRYVLHTLVGLGLNFAVARVYFAMV